MQISSSRARMSRPKRGRLASGPRRLLGTLALLAVFALSITAVALAVDSVPTITKQPASVLVEAGQPASFTAAATGSPAPTVQWEIQFFEGGGWTPISKATSTTYTIAKTENNQNSTKYRATFKNRAGSATTQAVTLTVATKPSITKNPANTTTTVGGTAVFEASAGGFPVPTAEWETSSDGGVSWSAVPGANSGLLFVSPPDGSYNGREYRAKFTNAVGSATTSAAVLTVQQVAEVTRQPEEQVVVAGSTVVFESTSAHGLPTPTEQWEVSTDEGNTWSAIEGATGPTLTISPALLSENGNEYRASFTNAAGTARSHPAGLYVAAAEYSAFGWGANARGQAGVGSNEAAIMTPLPIKGLDFVTGVSGGSRHSLALLANGTVYAWGYDSHGQIGNEGSVSTRSPVLVENLRHVTAVAAGGAHSLALLSNGTVMAWGDNESGQLGDGKGTDSEIPVKVEGLTGVKAIAAGEEHSLALLSNGTVMAWGNGSRGQLGAGGRTSHNSPVLVKGLSGVKAIAAGGEFSLALLEDGTVVAWGDDEHGQLGNNQFIENVTEAREEEGIFSPSPIAVEGLSGVTAIAAGRTHALALLSNGTVQAWGNDAEGELGNGVIEPQANTAVPVTGLSEVTAISAGDQESVAVRASGTLASWGGNGMGSLGNGGQGAPSDVPVEVLGIGGAAGVSAGAAQMIAFGASLPSVSSVSPSEGPVGGGTTVTITGSDIGGATAVHFGAAAATNVVVHSATSVTAVSPPGSGTVNVTVTTPSGTSPASAGARFTYHQPPTVLKLSAKGGPASGGTVVTITGTELTGATEVDFGAVATKQFTVVNASTIQVTAPASVAGTVDVKVITPSGTSAANTKDRYKYAPTVESVSPAAGPVAGGTTVTVTGTGFAPGTTGTAFKFGKGKVSSYSCESTTVCTVTAPAGKAPGAVDVTVTVNKAKSAPSLGDRFTYE